MKKTINIAASEVLLGNDVVKCKGLKFSPELKGLTVETLGLQVAAPATEASETPWEGVCPVVYAVDAGTVQASLPSVKLKGEYRSGVSTLTIEDTETITSDYLAMLEVLHSRANAAAAYIQPVLVQLSVIADDGRVLYNGMPVLVCPSTINGVNGLTVTRSVQYENGNYQAVGTTSVTASAFRIGIKWPDTNWQRVSHIRVCITPQLQACDFKGLCPTRLSKYLATAATLEVGMPGLALGAVPGLSFETIVTNALMHLKEISTPLANIYIPGDDRTFFQASGMSASEERRLISSLTSAGTTGLTLIPGTYTAKAKAINGTVSLIGNLSFSPNGIYSPTEMSLSTEESPWQGSIRVKYSDGRNDMVALFSSDILKPQTLTPLISVPDAAATSLTITVGTDVWEIPLSATADGLHAFAFNINGFTPTGTGTPETASAGSPSADNTLLAATDLTGNILAYTRLPKEIIAITPARNASGGLQFGQVCFYVFSVGGIFVARLNSAKDRLVLAQIDGRTVMSADLVAETSHGTVAQASGTLVCVRGNGVETLQTDTDYRALAWADSTGELWLKTINDTTIMRGLKGSKRTPGFAVTAFKRSGSQVLYQTADGWYMAGGNIQQTDPVAIEWCARLSGIEGRIKQIVWQLTASRFKGTLELFGLSENDPSLTPILLQRLTINGALNHRTVCNVLAPAFPVIEVRVKGTASPNSVFNGCKLKF